MAKLVPETVSFFASLLGAKTHYCLDGFWKIILPAQPGEFSGPVWSYIPNGTTPKKPWSCDAMTEHFEKPFLFKRGTIDPGLSPTVIARLLSNEWR